MARVSAAVIVTIGALASGCLGRSLATDTATVVVAWTFDSDYGCERADATPMIRIRSAIAGGASDDEELDWLPCLNELDGTRTGTTAPLPLGTYDVSATLAAQLDGDPIAGSTDVRILLAIEGEPVFVALTLRGLPRPLAAPIVVSGEPRAP